MWDELGLAPTREERAIRAAYAARLRAGCNPERDPEGFQRLRAAYDRALRWTAEPEGEDDPEEEPGWDDAEAEDASQEHEPSPATGTLPDSPAPNPLRHAWDAADAFLEAFRAALRRGDSAGAAAAVQAWRAGDAAFPLRVTEAVEDRVLTALLDAGEDAPPDAIAACALAYGWDDARAAMRHPALNEGFGSRMSAALWLRRVGLMADRAGVDAAPGHPGRVAAALLERPAALPAKPHKHLRNHPVLRKLLQDLGRHRAWLPDVPRASRVDNLRFALAGRAWRDPADPGPARSLVSRHPVLVVIGVCVGLALLHLWAHEDRAAPAPDRYANPAAARELLEGAPEAWVAVVQDAGGTTLWFPPLVLCRAVLRRARIGLDAEAPVRDLPLPPPDPAVPGCGPRPAGAPLSLHLPVQPARVSVQLTWADGTESEVHVAFPGQGAAQAR